jgi:hypothetical protein
MITLAKLYEQKRLHSLFWSRSSNKLSD